MVKEVRVTTSDNPYNPFTEWDDWFMFDLNQGYHTCERIASIAPTSSQLSVSENNSIIEEAIDQLIKTGAFSKDGKVVEYKKVFKD